MVRCVLDEGEDEIGAEVRGDEPVEVGGRCVLGLWGGGW